MDERIVDIEPISNIRPTRKLAFPDYQSGEGQKYQFTRSKKKLAKLANDKGKKKQDSLESASGPNHEDVADLKKRIAFDRAMTIGD